MENYIGKKYKPTDNSWSCNLSISLGNCYKTDPLHKDYLAGTMCTDTKTVTILTNPFKMTILEKEYDGISSREYEFVIVEYQEQQHIQLFNPSGVLEDDLKFPYI